jgi:hypothetical protein
VGLVPRLVLSRCSKKIVLTPTTLAYVYQLI